MATGNDAHRQPPANLAAMLETGHAGCSDGERNAAMSVIRSRPVTSLDPLFFTQCVEVAEDNCSATLDWRAVGTYAQSVTSLGGVLRLAIALAEAAREDAKKRAVPDDQGAEVA